MDTKTDLVFVRQFETDWQAHIAKTVLAEHGIKSIIDNEVMGSVLPLGFNSIGGFRLMVLESDYPRAREIVANMFSQQ